jgi:hypothetical protein
MAPCQSQMPAEIVGQCGSESNSPPSHQVRMLEAQEMCLFSSDIAKNPSDPDGQPDLIEKRPCALRAMFVFDFIAIA